MGLNGNHGRQGSPDRKTLQLCRQVAHAVQWALSSELGDELFCHLQVLSVVPAPNASHLLVTLQLDVAPEDTDLPKAYRLLGEVEGQLRTAVAEAITRRRAPRLSFQVLAGNAHPNE
jgi:ribosome-binding factor A